MLNIKTILPLASVIIFQACTSSATYFESYEPDVELKSIYSSAGIGSRAEINCSGNTSINCYQLLWDLQQLHLKYPDYDDISLALARTYFESERYQDSQVILDRILDSNIASDEPVVLRSQIALQDGNINLSRTLAENYIDIIPDSPHLYEILAASYYMEGRYDKALVAIESADRLGSPSWRGHYHMGLIDEARENWSSACNHYSEALADNPGFRQAISRLLLLSRHESCITHRL